MSQPTLNHADRFPSFNGYRMDQLLYTGRRNFVYRATQLSNSRSVILKLPQAYPASMQDLLRLQNYYAITKKLNLPGVIHPFNLDRYGNSFVLVMPDQGYISLSDYKNCHALSLPEVLAIALQLAITLHDLYQHRIIHKHIQPDNILIHPESHQIQLIDFSIASLLPKETEAVKHPNILEGALAYMAPEQTGRMNRGIDYRSDFYALGVTLFELLTGQLPFQSDDLLELVHCHLAQPAPCACDFNSALPAVIGQIVAKLMAKNPEDRYQNALGLKHDLEQALNQLQATQTIAPFELATWDISDRFLIPEKLYGRQTEVKTLLDAFDRVANGSAELMLIAGFSGVGKTAVVNEIHKPITARHGYFIKGKFDQFNRDTPLSAFVQALRDLMGQLLSESNTQLTQWQAKILAAVADNGQVLIEVIPELEYVIGQQPAAAELSGAAVQNRFNWLFQKFIQVFTTSEHPLVLFLDDLQWADSASLQLIKVLMEDKQYLMLLGAYRDNEVFPAHPLQLTLEDLKQAGKTINILTLTPLTVEDTNQWIAETLHCSTDRSQPLTELVMRKTQGNPFFVTQFLKALYQDKHITFDHEQGCWKGEMVQINALSLTDDVVKLIAQRLQKLANATQQVLKLAACIGNQFDLETLAIVSEQSEVDVAGALWDALQAELILPQSEVYKFYLSQQETNTHPDQLETLTYRFLHDRVQQAAYSLILDEHKASTHKIIGQLLLRNKSDDLQGDRIFEIVNQLNHGVALITEPQEIQQLAQLNLRAGCKAKETVAYSAASHYLNCGIQLITTEGWKTNYELTRSLHEEAAEIAFLNRDFEQMELLIQTVLQNVSNLLERTKVYGIQMQAHQVQGQSLRSIASGRELLRQFEIHLPETVTASDIQQAVDNTLSKLMYARIEDLIDLPLMHDPQGLVLLRLLVSLVPSAYHAAPELFPIIACEQVNLSLRYGNSLLSAPGYADFGIVLNGLQQLELGHQFGQLALKLVEQLQAKSVQSMTLFKVAGFHQCNVKHIRSAIALLQASYTVGLETGDFLHTMAAARFKCFYIYLSGAEKLDKLLKEIRSYDSNFASTQNFMIWSYILSQAIQTLTDVNQAPQNELREFCNEEPLLSILIQENDEFAIHLFFLNKLILSYLFNDLSAAIYFANQGEQYLNIGAAMPSAPAFLLYDALTRSAAYATTDPSQQPSLLSKISENQDRLRLYARFAPMNFQHKYDLVEAERHRILGNKAAAIDLYDRAIAGAKANEYLQEEAIANELAAQFYLAWGKEKVAASYMQEAYYCYVRWGAKAKFTALEKQYPQLLSPYLQATFAASSTSTWVSETAFSSHATALDLKTILQASQTLSSEIHFEQLLPTLIQLVVTNAGADKAALFLNSEGQLELAIKYFDNAVQSLEQKSVDRCQHVALGLIHYVEHTLETVITDYQAHPSTANDPHCLQAQPKSLLCTPILHQGQLIAVLYLENTIAYNTFTNDRLELLQVLCTQAAISLVNARLYQQAQSYAQQLEQSLKALHASEARFQKIAANSPGIIYQICIDLTQGSAFVPYISSSCIDLYEVSSEAIIAGEYSLRDFEHPDDRDQITQAIRQSAEQQLPFQQEFRIITPSGKLKWIQTASQPELQAQGWVMWDGVLLDISDRKAAEAERERLLQELSQLNQELEQANQQLALYSHDLEEKVAERTQELSQTLTRLQNTQQELIQFEKMAALGQLTASVAHEINTPLGVIRSATSNIAAAFAAVLDQLPAFLQQLSPAQQADFISLVDTALQQQSLSTQTERQLRRQLQAKLTAQGIPQASQIASQLTLLRLDLNRLPNPAIVLEPHCLEWLQVAYHLVLQSQSISSIQQEVDRAAKIVFALKTYSHQSAAEDKSFVALTETIEVALTLYQNRLKQGINVLRHYPTEIPELYCNPDELTQVWANLIDNAIHAMQRQGTLEISVTQQNDRARVEITDSGGGIPAEIRSRIFDPFFTTKPRGEGSGLGLDIVQQIVHKHAGEIEVQSQSGHTTFTVTLPLLATDAFA